MELSNRLETIASFVTEGYVVADIGTDHEHILKKRMQERLYPAFFPMDYMNCRKMM